MQVVSSEPPFKTSRMPAQEGYGTSSSVPPKFAVGNGTTNGTATVGIPGEKFDLNGDIDDKGHPNRKGSIKINHPIHPDNYFTDFTAKKAFLYGVATLYVISCGVVSVAEMFLILPCPDSVDEEPIKYPNPAYNGSKCPHIRQSRLLGLTPTECSFGRRLVMSILMGGLIGWERRQADRPAGIRTMSLVSLGSCLFTINSAYAFIGGPMSWDASRISAAIPSGVGFLGAGLIFKKTNAEDDNMVVHGLTTAASVWLSAAVGIACGGELYFAASFGTCLMMLLLRFGPRGSDHDDDDHDNDEEENEEPRKGEPESFKIEIPSGGGAGRQPAVDGPEMIFRNNIDDVSQSLPLLLPQQSSVRSGGSFTVTGESLETNSLAAETTPMLVGSKLGLSDRQRLQQQRRTPSKSNKIRKRQSKANLGSIV